MDDAFEGAFGELSYLAPEFTPVDGSSFPFFDLREDELLHALGLPPCSNIITSIYYPYLKGSYASGAIRRCLRKESRKRWLYFSYLSPLFDLPFELILEIFGHLHPVDLYSLIRSSKALRNILLNRGSFSVWQSSYCQHPDIPLCPTGVSFPRWTSLLFGPSTCDEEHFAPQSEFLHFIDNPEQRQILWTLVKASYQSNALLHSTYHSYTVHIYSRTEVDKMALQMHDFLRAISENDPKAEEEYAEFKALHTASAKRSTEHVDRYNAWSLNMFRMVMAESRASSSLVIERWFNQLKSMGYHPGDVSGLEMDVADILYDYGLTRFSKKVFRQSLPALQLRLAEEKASRLATEHELLINERKNAVRDYYEAYQQTLDPITWNHLPHWSRILDLKTIFRYTHFGECDGTFPSEAVQQDIRIFIEKWIEAGRRHFLQLLPDDVFNDSIEDPLSLACAVFFYPPPREHCLPTTALLGWQDLALHLDCFTPLDLDVVLDGADFTPVISFSLLGHDIVKHLLKTLDLDPNHVLATELVAVKQRFVCTTCPLVRSHGTRGTYVMTIAECVSHAHENSGVHTPTSFSPITEEALESVLFHEDAFSLAGMPLWRCRRCPRYFRTGESRRSIIAHIKEESTDRHKVALPREMDDYFYRHPAHPTSRKQCFLAMDEPANYRCKRCITARKARLWKFNQIRLHLKDKHEVATPIPGEDWYQIDFF
ncbi:hypothetical protein CVT26_003389 [Gymnopilus dilepis]|uniref:F-box domain-containing protein n=1 Tax=Gymnopilus dilepis TaxID=231916 RepID=A0A409VQP0_9AGAR|nr:hypothetical protein CVT26_003389 [Gymnopilus dilepis]